MRLTKEVNKAVDKAIAAEIKLHKACETLTILAKRYMEFPYDSVIFCLHQPGDGLVFCIDAEFSYRQKVPHNIPVEIFFLLAEENGIVTIDDLKKHCI